MPRGSRSFALVGALTTLTALAAVVRFVGIGHQSYWYDEAHTVWLIHYPLVGMLARLDGTETSPPLYFVLAWVWAHVFGYGEGELRSLSALAGVLTVPVAYAAGAKLFSRRGGLIVAAFTACSPLLVWYSQEARSYALLVLLTAVALLAFAYLRAQPTRGWMIVWALASSLALATHYYAALAVVPEAVWLFVRYRPNRMIRFGVEAVVVWSTWLAALALLQLQFLKGSNWIIMVPLSERVADVPKEFALGPAAPLGWWLILPSVIAAGVAAWLIMRRADRQERRPILLFAQLAASGLALMVALILLGFDQLDSRNLIALWLPVALIVAGGLAVRRAGALGTACAVALCAVGLATVIAVAGNERLQRPDWRGVAVALGSRPDRAIFAVNGCQLLPLSLYVPGLQFAPAGGATVREIDVVSAADQNNWFKVLLSGWYAVCRPLSGQPRLPRQMGSFRESGRVVRVGQFSVVRFRSRRPVRVTQRTFSTTGLAGALMIQRPGASQPAAGYSALGAAG